MLHIVKEDDARSRFTDRIDKLQLGIKVDSAGSLNEAMECIAEEIYDCIVYENHQSGKIGLAVLRSIRGQFVNCPFIFSTTKEIQSKIRDAFATDKDAYLVINDESLDGENIAELVRIILLNPDKVPSVQNIHDEADQEGLFYSLAGNLPQALLLLDNDGEVIFANQVADYLFGYDDSSLLVGKKFDSLLKSKAGKGFTLVRDISTDIDEIKNSLQHLKFNRREGDEFESDVCSFQVKEKDETFTAVMIYNASFSEVSRDKSEYSILNVYPTESQKLSVFVISDGIVVQSGLQRLLGQNQSEDYEYVEFSSGVLSDIGLRIPDAIIFACTNLNRPKIGSLKEIIKAAGRLPVLLVCLSGNQEVINDAIAEGVDGVILGESDFGNIPKAVKLVSQGSTWFPRSMVLKAIGFPNVEANQMVKHLGRTSELTSREQDVLKLLARGYKNKSIAEQLGLQYRTVVTHVYNIYRKLNLNNRTEAIHYAISNRLVRVD